MLSANTDRGEVRGLASIAQCSQRPRDTGRHPEGTHLFGVTQEMAEQARALAVRPRGSEFRSDPHPRQKLRVTTCASYLTAVGVKVGGGMGLAGCHLSASVSDRPGLKKKTVESDSRMSSCGLHACSSEAGVSLNLDLTSQLLLCHLTSFTGDQTSTKCLVMYKRLRRQ